MPNLTATAPADNLTTFSAPTDIPDLQPNSYCDATAGELVADGGIAAEQAYVRVEVKPGQYLDFCGHHYAKHEAAFITAGYRTLDRRERLSARADGAEVS